MACSLALARLLLLTSAMSQFREGMSGLRLVERGACCVLVGAHLLGCSGSPHTLYDVTFGTVPPVRIKSGEAGTVTLGGTRYSAWVEGMGSVSVTLHPE